MFFLSVTIFFLVMYSWLIFYYRKGWMGITDYETRQTVEENELPFISIIIAARNEEKNIGACIESIINQNYPQNKLEVIVIDDHSEDRMVSVIKAFQKENISVIRLADFLETGKINSYKKKSIETALQFAKGELIVTTDADCTAPPEWIQTLATFYKQESPVFVALLVAFDDPLPEDPLLTRLFKVFQSLDFMALQGITGASVYKKNHSMCNGANLAYQKKVFYEVKGFEGIDQIASGDDMLLMCKIQQKYPDKTLFLKSKKVIVQTQPQKKLKDFMNQRIRWASKASVYTDKKITLVLWLVYLLNAWIFILGIASFFWIKAFYIFLAFIFIKTFVELIFLFPVARFFGKQKQLWWFLPAQPFHIIYTLIAGWLGNFGSYQWKGRRVQ